MGWTLERRRQDVTQFQKAPKEKTYIWETVAMNHFFMLQRRHTISAAVNMQYTMSGMERERGGKDRGGAIEESGGRENGGLKPLDCPNNIATRRKSTTPDHGFELPMESAWLGSTCGFCFGEGGIGGGLCLMCSEKEYRITTGFFISLVVAKADKKEEVDAMWLYLVESVCPMLQTLEEEASRTAAKKITTQSLSPRKSSRLDSVKIFSPLKAHVESRLHRGGGGHHHENGSGSSNTRRSSHHTIDHRSEANSRKLQQIHAMEAKRAQRVLVEEKLTEFVVLKVTALLREEETRTASMLGTGLAFKPGTQEYFRHAFDLFNEDLVHSAICSLWRFKYYLGSLYLSSNYLAFVSINGDRKMCFPLTAIVSMKACKGFPFTEYLRVTAHAEEYRFVDMDDIRKTVTVVERTWKKAMLAYLQKQQEVQDRYMNDFITEAVASARPELQRSISQPQLENKYATHCTDNRNLFDAANSRLPWMHVNPDGANQLTKMKAVLETQNSGLEYMEGTLAVSFTSLFFLSSDESFSLVLPYGELQRMTLVKKDSIENHVTAMPAVIVESKQGRIHKLSCDSSEGMALILQSFRAVHTGVKTVARPRDWSPEECEQWTEKQRYFAENHYLTAEPASTRRAWQHYRSSHGCGPSMMRSSALLDMIHQGIPNHLRPELWQVTSGSLYRFKDGDQIPYQYFLTQFRGKSSEFIPEIERDLHRSLPEHPFYQSKEGINALRNVLTALSWRNSTIGYCQGMNITCAILLLYMSEEEVFYIMSMISETLLPEYYTKSMLGSLVDQQVIEALVARHLPDVYASLNEKVGGVGLVTVPWFMCLFVRCLPWEATLRTLDWFFAEGPRALFIVALATLHLLQREILHEEDGAVLLELLKHRIVEEVNTAELFAIAEDYAGKVSLQAVQLLRSTQKPKIARELIELAKQDSERNLSCGGGSGTTTGADTSETESGSPTESETETESESEEIDGLPEIVSPRLSPTAKEKAGPHLPSRHCSDMEETRGPWSMPEYPLMEEKEADVEKEREVENGQEKEGGHQSESEREKEREREREWKSEREREREAERERQRERERPTTKRGVACEVPSTVFVGMPKPFDTEPQAEVDCVGEEKEERPRSAAPCEGEKANSEAELKRISFHKQQRREEREERRNAARKLSSNKYAPTVTEEPTLLMPGKSHSHSSLTIGKLEESSRGRQRGSKRAALKESVAKYSEAVKPFLIRQGSSFTLEKSSREILSKRPWADGESRDSLVASAPVRVPDRVRGEEEGGEESLERAIAVLSPLTSPIRPESDSPQSAEGQRATPLSPLQHESSGADESPSKIRRAKTYGGVAVEAKPFSSPSPTHRTRARPMLIAHSQPDSHGGGSPTADAIADAMAAGAPHLSGTVVARLGSSYERSTSITAMFAFLDKADVRKAPRRARRTVSSDSQSSSEL